MTIVCDPFGERGDAVVDGARAEHRVRAQHGQLVTVSIHEGEASFQGCGGRVAKPLLGRGVRRGALFGRRILLVLAHAGPSKESCNRSPVKYSPSG